MFRVLLTLGYAIGLGAMVVADNFNPGMSNVPMIVVWVCGLPVGFAVGRWWVLLAVVGWLVALPIGYDPADHDGNPAFWLPRVVVTTVLLAAPLFLGWIVRWEGR
jgi:hypothetical protein